MTVVLLAPGIYVFVGDGGFVGVGGMGDRVARVIPKQAIILMAKDRDKITTPAGYFVSIIDISYMDLAGFNYLAFP